MTRKQRKSTGNEKRVNVSQGSVHIEKKRQHEIEIKKKHLRDLISSLVTSELPKDQLYHAFRTIATTKGGFLSDEFRQKIWPFLLLGNYSLSSSNERRTIQDQKKAHYSRKVGTHRDEIQLNKDIERSLWHYDVLKNIRETERKGRRRQLSHIINAVLRNNEELHYYQGYHDVCSVFLLVLGDQMTYEVMQHVSATYHRESMRQNFDVVMKTLRMLFPLIESQDPELFDFLKESTVEPFFALPWMITWFSHHLDRFEDVKRLFDVFICSHPLFCLYISASLVLENRQILLECECDFGIMHNTLSKLGTRIVDIDQIIHYASFLMQEIPPEQLHILSTLEESVAWSMYFEFPYFFQEHFQIKKSHIQLERPIKSLGTTITNISSQKDLSATSTRDETIKIWTIALCLFAMGLSMCSNEIETWQSLFSVAY